MMIIMSGMPCVWLGIYVKEIRKKIIEEERNELVAHTHGLAY